jgi:sulfate transport system permease protein
MMRRLLCSALLWRTLALGFLACMVLLPVLSVVLEAFAAGATRCRDTLLRHDTLRAAGLSLALTALAVAINTLFGLAAALYLARRRPRGRALWLSLLDLPLSISPVVIGLMLVLLYGRDGWLGPWLTRHGLPVLFSFPGMLLATIFVSLPYVAREVLPVLEEIGTTQEEAARTMGASALQTFRHVTLPSSRWGVLFGMLQCAARCLGEFGAVSVVSGKLIGRTYTLPLQVERLYLDYDTPGAFAAALPLVFLAFVTLGLQALLRRRRPEPGEAATRPEPAGAFTPLLRQRATARVRSVEVP